MRAGHSTAGLTAWAARLCEWDGNYQGTGRKRYKDLATNSFWEQRAESDGTYRIQAEACGQAGSDELYAVMSTWHRERYSFSPYSVSVIWC